MATKHGVSGTSDPNFKPDPNARHVYDEVKRVWRLVVDKPKKVNRKKPSRKKAGDK